ncbi:DNA-binding transcriptional regulator, LysR family [Lutimaribacter pacificus]|uniref:DNA-binding transcriptional regulator, LysR family n=1 Tax=Lutimaribacter pacificus TaxID=391948 RepID=A0A1H0D7E7_9RHOB|nr:LysR family transcriptional regulator [Lutimaribacter pacificus]SDN65861.1 DNA-binding transcriptional regulator, LysR family [Lutimaribacter pacificus]SHJ36143.1 DNA-binding transcriptional regulator, LysR family [Lutimaribacter pacificus]
MRLEWLEDIVAIFESDSLNEAAHRRYLTQPAFSRRVRSIEDYLGVELMDRSRKPARPTGTLVEQEERLRRLSADLKSLVVDLRKADRQVSSRVVIASQHAITTSLLPGLIADRLATLGYTLRLRSANRSECWGMLITKEADLVLTYKSMAELAHPPEEYMEELIISKEDLIPVGSAGMRPQIEGGHLPMIGYPSDVFLGKLIETEVSPHIPEGISTEVTVETALTVAAMQIAANGVGIAWIPRSMLENLPSRSGLVSYSDLLPTPRIATTATRLIGRKSDAEERIWAELSNRDHP